MYSDDYNNENENVVYDENNEENYDEQSNNVDKKKLWIVIAGIVLVIIIVIFLIGRRGNDNNVVQVVPDLLISSQKENLSIDNNIQLSARVTNIQNAIVTWASNNEEIAIVDQNGTVKGVGYGTTIITATYLHTDNMPYSVSCEVTVGAGDPNVKITDVRFQEGEILIGVGSEFDLPIIFEPTDGYRTNAHYTSSNEAVVSVDKEGKIKANSTGEATISLDFNDGQFKDEIIVNVVQDAIITQVFITVESIEFTEKLVKIQVGENKQLEYKILPDNALTSSLKWESSNESVATVSNGVVQAVSVGTADITVTSLDGYSEILTIEVYKPSSPSPSPSPSPSIVYATGITATPISFVLNVGETGQIVATVTPSNAVNKTISYSSSDPSVASVDANGLITANSAGAAIITLTTTNNITTAVLVNVGSSSGGSQGGSSGGSSGGSQGGSSSSCKSILYASPSSISTSKGAQKTITISFEESGDKVVRCYSSNVNVVKVPSRNDNTCTISAVGKGSANVTVVSEKNGCITIPVKVSDTEVKVTGIEPLSSSITVNKGNRASISPIITPSDATNKTLSCTSSDTSIATTWSSGSTCIVYGQKAGTTTILIEAADGSGTKTNVTVKVNDSSSSSSSTGTSSCSPWSKGASEVIYKVADTSACSIYNVSNCTGEECTVCENKKYSYSYNYKKTDGKTYIAYYDTGYSSTTAAMSACQTSLANLPSEKTAVAGSCSTYPIYNRVKYTRTCN